MQDKTILCAPDKFRGTITAHDITVAVEAVARSHGWHADAAPMADGGEGTIEVVSGELQTTAVTAPLGETIDAQWVLQGDVAVIEMARASGHDVVFGERDAIAASTRGTGELIAAAIEHGATRIIVGAGGSATTDGGWGAVEALRTHLPLRNVELVVATDVRSLFLDCARIYGPQKGASETDIPILEQRLQQQAEAYIREFGIDVRELPGSGAAGGLAGGLAAIGATIADGFSYFANLVGLDARIATSDLVITGEGKLDFQSTEGKVVDGVVKLARQHGKPILLIAGTIDRSQIAPGFFGNDLTAVSLVDTFGSQRALHDTNACITEVVATHLGEQQS